jgi:rhamnosyltransferase
MQVACIIPTFNGCNELIRLLDSLLTQTFKFDILIVDSSSNDGTQELVSARGHSLTVIPSMEFNHGGTRQMMVDQNDKYDIYVFLTQDAYLEDNNAISKITQIFANKDVGAVCGRQLPHLDATSLAQNARFFNYPDQSHVKTIEDAPKLGLKTVFMSNSFAAYRAKALRNIGGFPSHVIFAEDMYVTAKMLLAGWKVAYAGNAQCRHSHNYTIVEEFERYFDMGVFHAREPWIRQQFGGAGGEGMRYVLSELKFLGLSKLHLWPVSLLRNVVKLLGYKLGQQEANLPIKLKRKLSMYKRYWDGPFAIPSTANTEGMQ